jgi:hypothetical protein
MTNDELMKIVEKNPPPESWHSEAVVLLERMANLYPYHVEFINDPNCCEQCKSKRDVQQWLASYYAAASPLQPEPSPPQK